MEASKNQTIDADNKQGLSTGLISGLILGGFLFWLTIKLVQMMSQ